MRTRHWLHLIAYGSVFVVSGVLLAHSVSDVIPQAAARQTTVASPPLTSIMFGTPAPRDQLVEARQSRHAPLRRCPTWTLTRCGGRPRISAGWPS